jgi:co-chaperonin GroES (HSP10)
VNDDQFEAAELAQHQQRNGAVNRSGMWPVEYKILIAPEVVEEVSKGGIVLAGKTTEREAMAQVKGTLVAVGGNAFEDWKGMTPEIGDTIWFAKYAGYVVKGADGKDYRLANDKDCSAIIERKEGVA